MPNKKTFIIAEVGINHNGALDTCKELIDAAKDSDCDAVKFQKRDIDIVYEKNFLSSERESPWGNTQRAQKEGLEFTKEIYQDIDTFCKDIQIEWFASAWDLKSQEFLSKFNTNYNKVASAMIIYDELLEQISKEKKHTFISTGMSNYSDIDNAVNIFRKNKCSFELMHCISTYPMDETDANLECIKTLAKRYNCNVGYSGHESGLAISLAATALGATSIERHITLDRAMYGSDQSASIEPLGLKQLVGGIRKIDTAIGNGKKEILDSEKPIAEKLRAHLDKK